MAERLTLAELRGRFRLHPLRLSEIPVEHELSFPLPTLRFGIPAFAWFACLAKRPADAPPEYAPPDRWWALEAAAGRVLIYARTGIHAFGTLSPDTVRVPLPPRTMAEQKAAINVLEQRVTRAAEAFFDGRFDDNVRSECRAAIATTLPAAFEPWYRALVPDFRTWLGD